MKLAAPIKDAEYMATKQLPELHDAHLVGITYLPGAAIQLDFQESETRRSMLLTGVVHFFCSGMLEGNIVESVEIVDPDDVSSDDLAYFVENEGRGQSVKRCERQLLVSDWTQCC